MAGAAFFYTVSMPMKEGRKRMLRRSDERLLTLPMPLYRSTGGCVSGGPRHG
jgi:hypothetical protein